MESTGEIIYNLKSENCLREISLFLKENENRDFVVICKSKKKIDDNSLIKFLYSCIYKAQEKNADVLLGATNNFDKILQIDEHLFCIDKFKDFDVIVLFRSIFQEIIKNHDIAHFKIHDFLSGISNNIFLMHPFIYLEDSYTNADFYNPSDTLIEDLKYIRKFYRND